MICYNENEVTSYLDLFEQIWQDIKWEKIIVSLDDSSSDQEHLKLKNYEEDKIEKTLGKASIDYEVIDIDLWNGNTKASFVKASNMSRFKNKSVSFRSKSRVKQSNNRRNSIRVRSFTYSRSIRKRSNFGFVESSFKSKETENFILSQPNQSIVESISISSGDSDIEIQSSSSYENIKATQLKEKISKAWTIDIEVPKNQHDYLSDQDAYMDQISVEGKHGTMAF